jgi:hypothetical protein
MPPARALALTRAYLAAFFDQSLLGKPAGLLKGPAAEYPEAKFEHSFEQQ